MDFRGLRSILAEEARLSKISEKQSDLSDINASKEGDPELLIQQMSPGGDENVAIQTHSPKVSLITTNLAGERFETEVNLIYPRPSAKFVRIRSIAKGVGFDLGEAH